MTFMDSFRTLGLWLGIGSGLSLCRGRDISPFTVHFFNQGKYLWFTCISSTHSVQSFYSGNKILITGAHYFEVLLLLSLVSYLVSIYVHATRSNTNDKYMDMYNKLNKILKNLLPRGESYCLVA